MYFSYIFYYLSINKIKNFYLHIY
ncbi:hypothetical protein A5806_002647, partial [Enterococcus faecium]